MSTTASISHLNDLLSVCQKSLADCIDRVEHSHTIQGVTATTLLYHLRLDGNGQPMVHALADCLYNHVIAYCIAARNRPNVMNAQDAARLVKEARRLFIHPPATDDDPDRTGEAGELLLYLLIEAILGAPQVVAKMELKTNRAMEVHGSDGIHMAWNASDSIVDVYFGEAKLIQDSSVAIAKAIKSVDDFHINDMCRHEFKLVTKHFQHANVAVRSAVTDLLRNGAPTSSVRINHACLVGYNSQDYDIEPNASVARMTEEFRTRYLADAPRLHNLLQARFDAFHRKFLRFHVFFLPFASVQDFRDAFNDALK